MIYTLTLNPALDYNLSMEEFKKGNLNLSNERYYTSGGKGINVSILLKNLDIPSTPLGFLGGFSGDYIEKDLDKKGIKGDFVKIKDTTRINIKIKDKIDETEIAGISPNISEDEKKLLVEKIKKIKNEDYLVLSGSIPNSYSSSIYKEIIDNLPKKTKVFLDTRGDILEKTLSKRIFLAKPNLDEIRALTGKNLESIEEIIKEVKPLLNRCENIIISLGDKGSLFFTQDKVYRALPIEGKVVNTVGAGDSMLAGFLGKYIETNDLYKSYKFSVASSSASVFSKELGKKKDIYNLEERVEVEEV